jgi:hypothetical protein
MAPRRRLTQRSGAGIPKEPGGLREAPGLGELDRGEREKAAPKMGEQRDPQAV